MKYTKTHEWINTNGDIVTLGITDHAQEQLSDVVYVDFPKVGKKIEMGESFMTIESVKAASDIYTPVSGEVLEINEALVDSPEWVNQDPEEKGWLVKIKISDPKKMGDLLNKDDYLSSIKG